VAEDGVLVKYCSRREGGGSSVAHRVSVGRTAWHTCAGWVLRTYVKSYSEDSRHDEIRDTSNSISWEIRPKKVLAMVQCLECGSVGAQKHVGSHIPSI